jgi:phosphate starvation-inducible protein PhoH and related proteins
MKKKQDTSPVIPQRDKLKNKLDLKPLPWTARQLEFIKLALDKDTRVVFLSGPAGTSKTILAVFCALEILNQKKASDIVYIRSAVESADNKLGYLPGDANEKMSYYGIPFLDKLEELLPRNDIHLLNKEERITVQPVNFVRGQSWNARVALVDEAQNMTQKEIFTILTRVGKFSKCFVMADEMQSDINGKSGGFTKLMNLFTDPEGNTKGLHKFEFKVEDIMRDELTKFLVMKYQALVETQPARH